MKKVFLALALLLVTVFSLPASVLAATNPGVKPGSFFYFFDTTFEQVSLFFTFSPEKKVEKALAYANERLAEVEALSEEQNPNAVKTAISNYESSIALAAEKSKEVQDKEKAENLFTLIADNTSKNQEVLSAVLIKVPEEAREAITQAIEASKKGQEEAAQQIAELKSEVEQLKKEVADLKTENEVQTKAVEELNKQKPEDVPAPAKSPTPSVTQNQPQTLPKANEQQNIPSTNQQPTNTITPPPPVVVTPPPPVQQNTTPVATIPTPIPTTTQVLPPTPSPALLPVIASIVLLANPVNIPADGKTTTIITAKTEDKDKNPVSNQTLYFSYGGKTITQVTNYKGEASITYIATTYEGSVTITVSSDRIQNNISIIQKPLEGNLIFEKVVEGGAWVQLDITAEKEEFKIKQIVAVFNFDSTGNFNMAWNIRNKDWQYLSYGTLSNPWTCGDYKLEYPGWEPPYCEIGKGFYVDSGPISNNPSGFQLSIPKDATLRLRDIQVSNERFKIIYLKAVGLTTGKEVILENPSFDSKIIK